MDNIPVLNGLIKYAQENNVPFHMPGHKNNRNEFEELKLIQEYLYKIDCTEVPGLDNLHMPEEIIKEGQELCAEAYGAKKSFYLVNGSTCGVYSMIMGVTKPKDKIIVQRNCHRSVFTACVLGELEIAYINPAILDDFNIPVSLDLNNVKNVIDENQDAKAIVITYPTYYGTCCDLESIVKYAHSKNILVLVDEAHGAHLAFNEKLPKSAVKCGADIAVTSLHKSTPALTQCSLLNIGTDINISGVRFMLKAFQTTSPSYVFMASIDASRWIMQNRGRMMIDTLIENINNFRDRIESLDKYNLLSANYIGSENIYNIDATKIVISSKMGGVVLSEHLRKDYRIQVEMADLNNIVLISSIGDNKESFDRLYEALCDVSDYSVSENIHSLKLKVPKYKKVLNMKQAYYCNKKLVKLNEAEGLISSEMAAPYPPGVPVILPGEMITKEIIDYIYNVKEAGIPINGLSDPNFDNIYVVDL